MFIDMLNSNADLHNASFENCLDDFVVFSPCATVWLEKTTRSMTLLWGLSVECPSKRSFI